jgi:fructokinase
MTEVLVIGESLVDVVRDGHTELRHAGGSPMNVAYGLARLGVPASLLTRIGRDSDGALIEQHLYGAGVRLLPASLRDEPTSTAIATIAADGSASYEFDVNWDLADISATADWVHVGSIATFLTPGADAVERYLASVAGRVSYDPNIRQALMPADALERFERIARLTDVLKLSDEDAAWLYPDADDVIGLLLGLGPSVVAMTRGAAGATIASADGRVDVPAVPVVVKDTIGAGDSFMAALIAELIADTPLDAAAATAIAAAAITVSRAGAQPPTRAELP